MRKNQYWALCFLKCESFNHLFGNPSSSANITKLAFHPRDHIFYYASKTKNALLLYPLITYRCKRTAFGWDDLYLSLCTNRPVCSTLALFRSHISAALTCCHGARRYSAPRIVFSSAREILNEDHLAKSESRISAKHDEDPAEQAEGKRSGLKEEGRNVEDEEGRLMPSTVISRPIEESPGLPKHSAAADKARMETQLLQGISSLANESSPPLAIDLHKSDKHEAPKESAASEVPGCRAVPSIDGPPPSSNASEMEHHIAQEVAMSLDFKPP